MKGKTTRTAIIIVSLCTASVGWGWYHLSQRRHLPFPINAEPIVSQRIYNEFLNVDRPPDGTPELHHWKVLGDALPVPSDVAAQVRNILASPSTYTMHDSQCFEPGMAFSFGEGSNRVDVLICLLCNRAVFYRGAEEVGHCLSDDGNKRLSAIYERLFKMPATEH